jgi:hypothetical protein
MGFFKFSWRQLTQQNRPAVVTFTGGMGAQMISAAIYFSLKNAGHAVYADLSYFDTPENVAVLGHKGDCSHWSWQLEPFGLVPSSFKIPENVTKKNFDILEDGPQKLELALKAFAESEVQKNFEIPAGVEDLLPMEFLNGYLCMHVRRGDYVNVASHLIPDSEFHNLAKKISGLVENLVVLSDSPIGMEFRTELLAYFKQIIYLDNTDPFSAHRIMRKARILICSNSQFSLIAAALNSQALIFIPKQWFGEGERHIEAPIHARSIFQVLG